MRQGRRNARPNGSERSGTPNDSLRKWIARVICLGLLLLLPLRATPAIARKVGLCYLLGYVLVVTVVTFVAFHSDKRKAHLGTWRTPESQLHFLELIGGWPAAYIAQRAFRHKTAKEEYQFVFWAVVIIHQFISFDLVQDWKWSRYIYEVIKPLLR